jgi:hypothetical protein
MRFSRMFAKLIGAFIVAAFLGVLMGVMVGLLLHGKALKRSEGAARQRGFSIDCPSSRGPEISHRQFKSLTINFKRRPCTALFS